ncbi:hypothetical protein BJ684DRAFT_20381 [Piptocephalis cylindrospora]|uniref:SCP domain-containing protein n=1 Tax=Piptocephalis cylindrospora TaxID=1907219 RepID=A0A4P9Y2P4_9FUNG|nr:hypothetical protein BJ684DRAFT_20381 [Piptocephalis cylindrospora]|eukprot:RKP13105.1 hypothetical protein BJ684DRAFT_20381 [Piptocephalis cylindrospora]
MDMTCWRKGLSGKNTAKNSASRKLRFPSPRLGRSPRHHNPFLVLHVPAGYKNFDSRKFTSVFNAHREYEGRAKVKNMDVLDRVAAYRACYMADHGTKGSRDPEEGETLTLLINSGCTNCVSAGETIERGYETIGQLIDAYYTEPGLIPDEFDLSYTHFGIYKWHNAHGLPYYSIIVARVSGDKHRDRSLVYSTPPRLCGSVITNPKPVLVVYAGKPSIVLNFD